MISDLLEDEGISTGRLGKHGYPVLAKLRERFALMEIKAVAEFFCKNYRALRREFKWTGSPTPGLFVGFYQSIRAFSEGDRKLKRNIDRKFSDKPVEEWEDFTCDDA